MLASGEQGANCDPRYRVFIDYIVVRDGAYPLNFKEWCFEGPRLSDHCAISVDF